MADRPSAVDDVIQTGQPIPDDVTGMRDRDGDSWEVNEHGHWDVGEGCGSKRPNPQDPGTHCPLTVTAVREQPADVVPPEHFEEPVRIIEPLNVNGLIRDSREIMLLLGVTEAADVLPELTRRLAAPEPQQADASPVLDLVQQYGHALSRSYGLPSAASMALFARIAALVPQQPVQARARHGSLWWIHPCGTAMSSPDTPGSAHNRIPPCDKPGPWLPLLVGGDPAPERPDSVDLGEALDEAVGDYEAARAKLLEVVTERDEARAQVNVEIQQADGHAAWADRLAWAALNHTDSMRLVTEEASGNEELWQLALDALTAQPDPLVLSLPEVPEGTESVVGSNGWRWLPRDGGWWNGAGGATWRLVDLLATHGPLTVELAPPREPRTWPKLDGAPEDLRVIEVEGHGRFERAGGAGFDGSPMFDQGVTRLSLARLRELGDVIEVTE